MHLTSLRNNAGDTIVEVLVVLAILGLALSISYATASRSLLSTNGAQENSKATALLQAQAEVLRYMAPQVSPPANQDVFGQSGPFCIDTTALTIDNSFVSSNLNNVENPDSYPATCKQTPPFHIAIVKSVSGANYAVFDLTAKWSDIHGDGVDTVTLSYRVYND